MSAENSTPQSHPPHPPPPPPNGPPSEILELKAGSVFVAGVTEGGTPNPFEQPRHPRAGKSLERPVMVAAYRRLRLPVGHKILRKELHLPAAPTTGLIVAEGGDTYKVFSVGYDATAGHYFATCQTKILDAEGGAVAAWVEANGWRIARTEEVLAHAAEL